MNTDSDDSKLENKQTGQNRKQKPGGVARPKGVIVLPDGVRVLTRHIRTYAASGVTAITMVTDSTENVWNFRDTKERDATLARLDEMFGEFGG